MSSIKENMTCLDNRLTPAQCPSPLHCSGRPPSSYPGSALTWQSPTAAPPVLVHNSSLLQRPTAAIYWPAAPPLWMGCRQINTSHPVQGVATYAQHINNKSTQLFFLIPLSITSYLTREREPGFWVRELSEQLNESLCLFDTWDCFICNEISSCCCQAFRLWPMPRFKLLGRERIKQQNTTY